MGSSALPQSFWREWVPEPPKAATTTGHAITTAASVRLCHRLRLGFHLRSSLKRLFHLCEVPRLKASQCQKIFEFNENNFFHFTKDALFSSYSPSLCFFDGGDNRTYSKNEEGSNPETSGRNSINRRQWTNALLGLNVLIYIAQIATQGKLLLWGAKVNSLIDKGQVWRLATSSVLHANIGHLMINCYSLNSVGPTVENISGPKRFLAVYLTSAIASSAMSYWFSKAPSVGASGAIFGLVGSVAVFVLRHRRMLRGGNEVLKEISQVIVLNMAMGLLSRGIDNWGHMGGFLGGAATSWLLGPVWKHESTAVDGVDGRRILVDRAPFFYLINRRRQQGKLD